MAHVLFDMNGTLLDPAAMAEPLGGSEADRELIGRALDLAITASMAVTVAASETQPPFTDLLEAGLGVGVLTNSPTETARVGRSLRAGARSGARLLPGRSVQAPPAESVANDLATDTAWWPGTAPR